MKDIIVYYKTGDPYQIQRLRKYVRVKQWKGERVECERAFISYRDDMIDYIDAKEYIGIMHADFLTLGFTMHPHPKITKWIAVSKVVAENFTKLTGLPCEVCYNPLETEEPRRVLRLVSTTRLTWEKGRTRMEKLAKKLDEAEIPFMWFIYTDSPKEEWINNKSIIYKPPIQDNALLMGYVQGNDYLVQFSNSEAYCYAVADALKTGVPVLVTDCPVYKELGIENGNNGYILDFELDNLDLDRIYNEIPKDFEFKPPKDNWEKYLVDGESQYQRDMKRITKVVAREPYWDIYYKKMKYPQDAPYDMNLARAKDNQDRGLVRIIEDYE